MAQTLSKITSPAGADYRLETGHRKLGLWIGAVGIVIAMIVAIIGIIAGTLVGDAGEEETVGQLLAIDFGLNPIALATLKFGIAVILIGIIVRLFLRVDSIKAALPDLRPKVDVKPFNEGEVETPFGTAVVSSKAPKPLPIHRMARALWAPMLGMGAMLVAAGFVLSIVWAANVGSNPETAADASAWTQGLQFLGEALVLSGIAFLLGSILAGLREGGGYVQESLGLAVKTLRMPNTAKAFVVLMVTGVMVAMAQLVLYVITTTFDSATDVATWFAWLGPLREVGLGLILASIVLALVTIGNVLTMQFGRVAEICKTGQ